MRSTISSLFAGCLIVTGAAFEIGCNAPNDPAGLAPGRLAEGFTPKDTNLPAQPNVVLVIIDTLRADKLGSYGYPLDTSPELDTFAELGVRFHTAIAPSSWTRPSVGAMVTGRYPRSLGLYVEKDEILPDRFVTLAEALGQSGYTSFGMTANPNINSVFNFDQGFDEYVDSNIVFVWMDMGPGQSSAGKQPLLSARDVFRGALDFAEAHGDSPVFMQLDIMDVHQYRHPIPLTRKEFLRLFPSSPNARYLQSLRQVSLDIHEFVVELSSKPGWKNTLYIFVGDHGEGLNDHPGVKSSTGHGPHLYESSVRVPLIFYSPTWKPIRSVVRQRVRLIDILPTVLEFAGADPVDGIDGISLLPLMTEAMPKVDLPKYFITETEYSGYKKIGVYGEDWKYIVNQKRRNGLGPHELQPRGPRENGSRTDQESKQAKVAGAMRGFLKKWEASHQRAKPTFPSKAISAEEREQLESLGYLQNE